jgi:arabinofuranan 3-O-arabinosyltransferase
MMLMPARPGVTVVVPTRNSARTVEACLRSIKAQSVPVTVVVVDNGSSDGTAHLTGEMADLVLEAGPERSAQRNLGAHARPAPIVGFIDSDMILAPDVVEQSVVALEGPSGTVPGGNPAAVVVPERTIGEGYWSQVRAFERSFYVGSDDVEAARFYRWDVFESLGGFDEGLTGCEDWDLTIRARQLGPVVRIEAMIDHDEGQVRYFDACRKKGYYAEGLRRFTLKHGAGTMGKAAFDRPYLHKPRALLNPLGAGLVALKAGELVSVATTIAAKQLSAWRASRPASGDRP